MTSALPIMMNFKVIAMIFRKLKFLASFLDLSKDHDIKFTIKLFDKRNVFPFYINRMLYLNCNMPSKILYVSVGSEILRIARTSADDNTR